MVIARNNFSFQWPSTEDEFSDRRNPRAEDVARLKQMETEYPARKSLDKTWIAIQASDEQVLTHENHCKIEDSLAFTPHAKKSVNTWILVPDSDQSGTDIRCSLTITEFSAYLKIPGEEIQTVRALYAGSAATPMHHRKMGYARSLVTQVMDRYKPKDGEYLVCQWFSHAGQLFSKLNAKISPCWNFWADEKFQQATDADMSQVRYLKSEDHARIVKADNLALETDVKEVCEQSQKITIVMKPDADCLEHKFEQGYQTINLAKTKSIYSVNEASLSVCGAEIINDDGSAPSFALWRLTSLNKPRNELYLLIIRLRYKSQDELRKLMTAAIRTSIEWGCGGRINIRTNENNFDNFLALPLQSEAFDENKGGSMSVIVKGDDTVSPEALQDHKALLVERYMMG